MSANSNFDGLEIEAIPESDHHQTDRIASSPMNGAPDTTPLSPTASGVSVQGHRYSPPGSTISSAYCKTAVSANAKLREEKVKRAREELERKREAKLAKLQELERHAESVRIRCLEERKKRVEELRKKSELRSKQVEERRRQNEEEEKEKKEAILRKLKDSLMTSSHYPTSRPNLAFGRAVPRPATHHEKASATTPHNSMTMSMYLPKSVRKPQLTDRSAPKIRVTPNLPNRNSAAKRSMPHSPGTAISPGSLSSSSPVGSSRGQIPAAMIMSEINFSSSKKIRSVPPRAAKLAANKSTPDRKLNDSVSKPIRSSQPAPYNNSKVRSQSNLSQQSKERTATPPKKVVQRTRPTPPKSLMTNSMYEHSTPPNSQLSTSSSVDNFLGTGDLAQKPPAVKRRPKSHTEETIQEATEKESSIAASPVDLEKAAEERRLKEQKEEEERLQREEEERLENERKEAEAEQRRIEEQKRLEEEEKKKKEEQRLLEERKMKEEAERIERKKKLENIMSRVKQRGGEGENGDQMTTSMTSSMLATSPSDTTPADTSTSPAARVSPNHLTPEDSLMTTSVTTPSPTSSSGPVFKSARLQQMMQGGRLSGLSKTAMLLKRHSGIPDDGTSSSAEADKSPSNNSNPIINTNQEEENCGDSREKQTAENSDISNSDSAYRSSEDSQSYAPNQETTQESDEQEKGEDVKNDSSVSDKAEASFDSAIEESSSVIVTMDTTSMDASSPDHVASLKTESTSDQVNNDTRDRQMDSVSSQDEELCNDNDQESNLMETNQDSRGSSNSVDMEDCEDSKSPRPESSEPITQLYVQTEDMDEDVDSPALVDSNITTGLQEARRIILNPSDIDMVIEDPNSPNYSPNIHSDDSKWPLAAESQTALPVLTDLRS